ncbi:MAG: hypothetical protein LC676_10680 [Loktanella sp.]|nr:hypothetical protein [Loktanella sp.]
MAKYQITKTAGRFVAGHRNTGVGTILDMPEAAAAFDLRTGALVPMGAAPAGSPTPEVYKATPDQLNDMLKAELIDYAEARGIDLADGLLKAEILEEIIAAEGNSAE